MVNKKIGFTLAEVEICGVRSEAETRGSEGKLSASECASECASEILPRVKQISKQAFTLAEVLITLAIIGVVAALTIPSVISNSQQQEFKTGLRKAVSVLNSAITMSMALDGESPYDNANLMGFFMKHMAVIKSTTDFRGKGNIYSNGVYNTMVENAGFYTTDGMRFEFRHGSRINKFTLYENPKVYLCFSNMTDARYTSSCNGCGSYGLNSNPDNTTKPPCLILVDVNGDRKPNPPNEEKLKSMQNYENILKYSDPDGKKLTDMFTIMITDKEAIPYGVASQRAMYNSQK